MEKYTPEQDAERLQICRVMEDDFAGGCAWFEYLSVEDAKKLLALGYADPNDAQNLAPTFQEMVEFCEKNSTEKCIFYMHGYVVSNDREDRRVSIEGVQTYNKKLSYEQKIAFAKRFKLADEYDQTVGYCWYD